MSPPAATVPGIDAARVGAHLSRSVPGAVAPFEFRLISGGRSNLTYEVRDGAGTRYVLRRPPLGHVLESAHDVGREARIMRALAGTAVPVPPVLDHCDDATVTGGPFTVMGFVDGAIVRDAAEARVLTAAARFAAAQEVAGALAALHAVDPDAAGLGDLGRRDDYAGRQLRRWSRQWAAVSETPVPEVEEAHRRLAARVPEQGRTGIVHGDFRLDNLVLGAGGDVRAILDWELCALGDVRADVAMLATYWTDPGERTDHLLSGTPTAAGGFGSRDDLLRAYAGAGGADLGELDWFVALGLWRLACIAGGIRARYAAGAMGDDDGSSQDLDRKITGLAAEAIVVLERA